MQEGQLTATWYSFSLINRVVRWPIF